MEEGSSLTFETFKLTEGVPRFEGTPAQLAAYQLVQNFEAKDYELMSRLQQSRDVNAKFRAADQLLSTLMSGQRTETGSTAIDGTNIS